jgi:hypothetical protein
MGHNELKASDVATTVSRVLEHVPTNVESVRDDLPPGLGELLSRALAKNRAERHQDAAALAAALRALRPATEEAMQTLVRATVRRDFTDPSFAGTLGVASLAEREQALKSTPRPKEARPGIRRRSTRWTWLALATVGGAAVVAIAWMLAAGDHKPTFVVIDRNARPDETANADAGAPVEPSDPITRAFQRNQRAMDACAMAGGAPASGRFEIVVRIGTDGTVTSARLDPPELSRTALGLCVLDVATSARFPSGRAAVQARFPVRFLGDAG